MAAPLDNRLIYKVLKYVQARLAGLVGTSAALRGARESGSARPWRP